jgi:hypothetical protein
MEDQLLGAARIFANHYQLVVCDDPTRSLGDDENWNDEKHFRGFAGAPRFRMVGTEADQNDHWVELVAANLPPDSDEWQRITCVHFQSTTGMIHVMSVTDNQPTISAEIEPGDYAVYFAAQNLGIDPLMFGNDHPLTDAEISRRKDAEWYRLFLVSGKPATEGRIIDRPLPVGSTL